MIEIGCSGFSYDDWCGTFYAPGTPKSRMLEAYADVFSVVELNVSYYRTPPPSTAESMVKRTAGRLRFAVKAPGDLTHQRQLNSEVTSAFLQFLEPFASEGVLAAVLLQFPGGFRHSPSAVRFLGEALNALSGHPCAVEMRHESWDEPAAREALRKAGVARVGVDQPDLKGLSASIGQDPEAEASSLAYFRFHGRNAANWYAKESSHARYTYRYSEDELRDLAPVVREAGEKAETTLVFFNNHPDGAAPNNAETFAGLLEAPLRGSGYRDLFS